MAVTCHVGPDAGWPVLEEFLSQTQKRLTVGMYDFTAPHVLEALEQDLGGRRKRELNLVLDPGPALGNGGDEEANPRPRTRPKTRSATRCKRPSAKSSASPGPP
jgi:hypothetical protein